MPHILLINPNTSPATTDMMVAIVTRHLPGDCHVTGCTAATGVPMIVNQAEMQHASLEVHRSWQRHAHRAWDGVIVSAFGDPGMASIRSETTAPVVGICEASLLEAAQNGKRPFGIATVTPDLEQLIQDQVHALGLAAVYTGIRLTSGDPRALAADPERLHRALKTAVHACAQQDGAQAVVIGGGPLGEAASRLQEEMSLPVIAPLAAAAHQLVRHLNAAAQ